MMRWLWTLTMTGVMFAQGTQTWIKVADDSTAGPISLPSGMQFRWGASTGITQNGKDCSKVNCWFTATSAGTSYKTGNIGAKPDPAPGLTHELDILQTNVNQTITIAGTPVTIPAKQTGGTVYVVTNCAATFSGTLTVAADGTSTLTGTTTLNTGCAGVKQ